MSATTETAEYRIEFTIQRNTGNEDWQDVGFGSSGAWNDIDSALYQVDTSIQRREWETEPGMPEPSELEPS
ncbi:MAG TPA: hypothetical protein VHX38_01970 [Pseudonocardiaceae bacterium]|jgi:hypothetical protein|nr:hypothetical protein [Pseudonocardiaceae bacterium]